MTGVVCVVLFVSSSGAGWSGHGYKICLSRRGEALEVEKLTFTIRASDFSGHLGFPGRPLFPAALRVVLRGGEVTGVMCVLF